MPRIACLPATDPRAADRLADGTVAGYDPTTGTVYYCGRYYHEASWHNTLPYCAQCDRIVVGFRMPDAAVLSLRLDAESARHLAETLAEFLAEGPRDRGQCPPCGVHSDRSSGSPQADVSIPVGVPNV